MKNYLKTILKSHLVISVTLILTILVIGTVGYILLENLSPIDGLYHTVTIISTVGFSDVQNPTTATKIFTIGIILSGVAAVYYFAAALAEILISGRIFEVFKLGTICEESLGKITGHVILCGYGDVGALVAEEIKGVVVVEQDDSKYNDLLKKNYLAVKGDSTNPETLKTARVDKAKSMVIALDSDPEVVYTILTAKELNPDIKIYARANETTSVNKMKKAGANYVICLPEIGSRDLVNALQGSIEQCLGHNANGEKK